MWQVRQITEYSTKETTELQQQKVQQTSFENLRYYLNTTKCTRNYYSNTMLQCIFRTYMSTQLLFCLVVFMYGLSDINRWYSFPQVPLQIVVLFEKISVLSYWNRINRRVMWFEIGTQSMAMRFWRRIFQLPLFSREGPLVTLHFHLRQSSHRGSARTCLKAFLSIKVDIEIWHACTQ